MGNEGGKQGGALGGCAACEETACEEVPLDIKEAIRVYRQANPPPAYPIQGRLEPGREPPSRADDDYALLMRSRRDDGYAPRPQQRRQLDEDSVQLELEIGAEDDLGSLGGSEAASGLTEDTYLSRYRPGSSSSGGVPKALTTQNVELQDRLDLLRQWIRPASHEEFAGPHDMSMKVQDLERKLNIACETVAELDEYWQMAERDKEEVRRRALMETAAAGRGGEDTDLNRRRDLEDVEERFGREKESMMMEMERVRQENKSLLEQMARPMSDAGSEVVGSEYRRVVDEVAELKTKLREAQRAAEEAMERRKDEEDRSMRLQKQLKDIRDKGGDKSGLEVQLMQQIVSLQKEKDESSRGMLSEMDKVKTLQTNVREKSDEALGMHRKAQAAEKQRQDLQAQVSEAMLKIRSMEEDLTKTLFVKDELESGMELVQKERDETIEFLQKAVEQNRDLKVRRVTVKQQLDDDKRQIHHAEERDVEVMKTLLFNLENIISKQSAVTQGGVFGQAAAGELRKDMVNIRDAVRQLLSSKGAGDDK